MHRFRVCVGFDSTLSRAQSNVDLAWGRRYLACLMSRL